MDSIEVCPTLSDLIADYADGSGRYRIYVTGEYMTTRLDNSLGGDGEAFTHRLTRAPEFDAVADRSDYMLTETFGSSPDHGDDGVVWINGEAFTMEWADEVYLSMTAADDAPAVEREIFDEEVADKRGAAYLARFVGALAQYTTWEGETLTGVVESFDNCTRPVIRFADGKWATGSVDGLVAQRGEGRAVICGTHGTTPHAYVTACLSPCFLSTETELRMVAA